MKRRTYLQIAAGAIGGGVAIGAGSATDTQLRQTVLTDGERPRQVAKLTPDDGDSDDRFGRSVAIDGTIALVGAYGDDPNGIQSGSVYVVERTVGKWFLQTKFAPEDGDDRDYFGGSVALDGETALVGAPYDEDPNGRKAGSAYVFERTDGEWTQQTKLSPDDVETRDEFGHPVALKGETALISAYYEGNYTGSVYVFERTDGEWTRQAKLTPDGIGGRFGGSIALDGETILVGEPFANGLNGSLSGSAHVFERTDGEWTRQTKLAANDGDERDFFGSAVALEGETALVGAPDDDEPNGDRAGSMYAFERTDEGWRQQDKLAPDDGDSKDDFGYPIALAGERALVGAESDEDPNGEYAGSVYVFERTGGGWDQQAKLVADDGDDGDLFGSSIGLTKETAIIGAAGDEDPNGRDAGSAYVFDVGNPGVPTPETPTQTTPADTPTQTPTPTVTPTQTATPTDTSPQTATPTRTATPTDTSTQTPTNAPAQTVSATETTDASGPGFGVVTALSGMCGWLWWRHSSE